jgi:metallo-beta-lactamase family protein
LFTGYQAGGTRGDRIVRGERKVKIFGEMVPIKAHVELLSNLSAHADYQEILDWLSTLKKNPKKVFITHGEPEAALSLKKKIEDKFGWTCVIPHYLQKENL